jgi:MscS family membrane protein
MFAGSYFKILAFCVLAALSALAWNPVLTAGDSVPVAAQTEMPRGRALAKIMNSNGHYDADGNIKTLRQHWDNIYSSAGDWFDQHKFNMLVLFGGIILTLVISAVVSKIFAHVIIRRLAARNNPVVNDLICEAVIRPLHVMVFSIGLFLSALPILESLPPAAFEIVFRVFLAVAAGSIAWAVFRLTTVLNHFLMELASRTDNNLDNLLVDLIRKAVKLTIAIVSTLFIGQSILGINITTLLAGAGVCGLALAFAAKDTVANFFGSVMIIVDKPFSVGDRIKIENVDGVVESVGFRSTRIRTLDGHLFTIPNSKVADAAVENISKRPYIKCAYSLGLAYDTPPEKVDRAVQILHEILDSHESFSKDMPPVICFDAFKDWSLNISVAVWHKTTDWNLSRKWLQEHNLAILKRFNEEGLEFAFPTNTSYLAGDRRHPVQIDKRG